MKQAFRDSLWLPGAILVCGVLLVFVILTVADGASSTTGTAANYPPPFSPCTYVPIIRNLFSHTSESADSVGPSWVAPAATPYPPPSSPCGALAKRLYVPIIRRQAP